ESVGSKFPRLSAEQAAALAREAGAQVAFTGTTSGRNGERLWFSTLKQRYVLGTPIPIVGERVWAGQQNPVAVHEGPELITLPLLAPDGASRTMDVQMGWAPPAEIRERKVAVCPAMVATSESDSKTPRGADVTTSIDLPTRRMQTVSTTVRMQLGEHVALSIP